jgi:hypothetical protein
MSITTTPVSSPREVSHSTALLAPSSAGVISNLAKARLKPLAEPSGIPLVSLTPKPVEIYYENLQRAIESFKKGKVDEARQIFNEAINALPKTDDLEHNYAHAVGWINLAATFELGHVERNNTAMKAQPFIDEVYDKLDRASNKEEAHPLRVLLNELSQLLTDKMSFTYLALRGKIVTLDEKYGEALPNSHLLEGFSLPDFSTLTSPRGTKDLFDGSWKTAKVFFAFAVASLVIAVSAFALYRSVTKIE